MGWNQSKPYQKACNQCGVMITMGVDDETGKWRPWDDLDRGVKHNCRNKPQPTRQASNPWGKPTQQLQQQQQPEADDEFKNIMINAIDELTKAIKRIEDKSNDQSWKLDKLAEHLKIGEQLPEPTSDED